ncbi:hypothetical protein ACIGO8_10745 [Streptomyces sp. NPDC053493]|uniref:hypothetical protein n=1 Tax=Streptomyces sp. NPDC053493 TaxID=3365705 RepID=UPI0037D1F028
MAVFVHAVLNGVSTDQYDALNAKLQGTPEIFEGCLSHVCVPTDSGLEIFDLWETERQMNAFTEKMMPVAADLGWPVTQAPPRTRTVHNYWVPGADA